MLYDKDIREPLFYYLEERFGKSRILEELNMGRSRADVVMVLPASVKTGTKKILFFSVHILSNPY